MNSTFEKTLANLIFSSLMVLALGLVTSMSLLSLSHIFMIIPIIYFLPKANYKKFPKSAWALLALTIIILVSVVFNQDIAINGYKPLGKTKYFFFGFLMIAPLRYYFKIYYSDKKISYLLYAFCIATTVATIVGLIAMKTGYNYLSMREVRTYRNAGLSGMVLNYAHNLASFQIIIIGLILFRKELEKIINKNFIYIVCVINLIGLYMSYTRGAILALIIGVPFYFFKKNKLRFLSIGIILVLLAFAAYSFSGSNLLRPGSDKERLSQWQAALYAFKERPVLGYGYLNFETHSVSLKEKYGLGELQFGGHAHNNFLEILATTGIIGFLCYIAWLFLWFLEMYRRNDIVARISLPLTIVIILSGMTQSTISLGVNLFFIMAAYAIGQASGHLDLVAGDRLRG